MMRLGWWLIRAQLLARRSATALSMLAIALGVALGYAIHLINDAALADFSRAMKAVQGEPDVVIAPRDGAGHIPLALVDQLSRDAAVAVLAPVIETRVRIGDTPLLARLIGLDPFSAALLMPTLLPDQAADAMGSLLDGAVFASPALAEKVGADATLMRGAARWQARIGGELAAVPAGEKLLVADIAWVQAHFGPRDGVGEIRIRLSPGMPLAAWRAAWAPRLPAGIELRAAEDNQARVSNISRAYRVNLNVLAMVALLTGAFLVFATQLTAVAQRSTQFALLGVLGLPPRLRLLQVLVEGLAIGVPGSLLGLLLGCGLAVGFTRVAGGDLGGGFFSPATPVIVPQLLPTAGFFALGCLASLLGALYPAWLNRIQPLAQALKTGFAQGQARGGGHARGRDALLILALAVGALALARVPAIADLPLGGYAAIALLLMLGIVCAPLATRALFGAVARARLPAPLKIAVQNILQAPLMAQVAASGLIVSFALTVSMVTMVASFRTALDQWLDAVLPAPLYMRSKAVPLPAELLADLARADSPFQRVERMAASSFSLDPQRPTVALLVREIDRRDPGAQLPFTGAVADVAPGGIPVWISEAMQQVHGIAVGQRLRLPLLGREIEVTVSGVWRDYARQFGAVVMTADDYLALGGRFEATDLALWPRPGQEAAAQTWLRGAATRHGVEATASGEIRELSLSIFDKSFAITHALEAAAMLIGLFGLAVTLAASVGLRARELAMLAALGFDRAMLGRAVVFEGALVTCVGLALGLAAGIAVGAILTHVVNPQAFHWRMPLAVPWPPLLAVAAATLAAGMLASGIAARRATRLPAAQVLASAQ
ncbi:MAG: ABC transporter permease [Rhodocyclales bacterium]|nr:ABC transporter permease [Rhodocyclales bacterium]